MADSPAPLQQCTLRRAGKESPLSQTPALPFLSQAPPSPLLSCNPPVLWTGIWFVGFCFLANQWQHSPPKGFLLGSSSAKAAITFAFFSILIWVRMGPLWRAGLGD